MARTFLYEFEDGYKLNSEGVCSKLMEALTEEHGKCTYNGWAEFMGVGKPSRLGVIGGANSRGDAFKTGYHPGLGMEIKSPSHYRQVLKEKGMVEVGNEKPRDPGPQKKSYIAEEVVKEAIAAGAELSGREADALVSGKVLSE